MFNRTQLSASILAAFGGVLSTNVCAQSQESQQLDRVEITGSAIRRLDAETTVPVTVLRVEELKKQGVTSVEQIMSMISSAQVQQGTSQAVGAGTGGAAFADLRGIGANKSLVLLNGRRIANNALDSSAPDLNMIPFAVIERVEILRDGASSLYGTDAIGGVINFITRRSYTGVSLTAGYDKPEAGGGQTKSLNGGVGFGDLETSGFNVLGFVDYQKQSRITGLQRPFNTRIPGGLSPTTFPGNYFQGGDSGNPTAPDCNAPNLIPDSRGTGCQITTSSFVDYVPETERVSGMLKGSLKLGNDHTAGIEYFRSRSEITNQIAPVPYGGLRQNRTRPDGTLNPFYPGNPGSSVPTPNIPLDPNYAIPSFPVPGLRPGYVNVRFRDLATGPRTNIDINTQQRLIASLQGAIADWDYQTAISYNENKYENRLSGYSNGAIITAGVLDGIINPFGDQTAEGSDLIASAGLAGTLQNAKGRVAGIDARASRELGDWLGAGRAAAIAVGADFRREKFEQKAEVDFATAVIASTGFDPNTNTEGSRNVAAVYTELNVPILKNFEVTGALRYDRYSDFGNTTNPKVSFRFQPAEQLLFRGSYSTGFRAPSLYEINAAQTYTNTENLSDPVNCPDGENPIPGKSFANNCQVQFQTLFGGNKNLEPEKSKNATFGILIQPVADLSFGLDFWWIQLKNTIGLIDAATILSDADTFAAYIIRNPDGDLATDGSQCPDPNTCGYIDGRTSNLGKIKTNGVDISAAYRIRNADLGTFGFALQSTYILKNEYQDFKDGPYNDNVDIYSGAGVIFRWQHNAAISWNYGSWGLGLAGHYKSDYLDQDPSNTVGGYATVDFFGAYSFRKQFNVTLGVKNLFDRDPPFSNQTEVFQAGYDPRYTDPTGRTFYARVNYEFN